MSLHGSLNLTIQKLAPRHFKKKVYTFSLNVYKVVKIFFIQILPSHL